MYIKDDIAKKLNAQEMYLYSILKKYMNNDSKQCYPSIQTLSEEAGWCRNTTKKWIRSLEKKGIIEIKERKIIKKNNKIKKVWNDTHLYTFILERVGQYIKNKGAKGATELISKSDLNDISLSQLKVQLIANFGKEIATRALQAFKEQVEQGTIVKNIQSYLITICKNIKKQVDFAKSIVGKENKKESKQVKSPSVNGTRAKKNSFHNFQQRTPKYNNEQLENKIKNNWKHKLIPN